MAASNPVIRFAPVKALAAGGPAWEYEDPSQEFENVGPSSSGAAFSARDLEIGHYKLEPAIGHLRAYVAAGALSSTTITSTLVFPNLPHLYGDLNTQPLFQETNAVALMIGPGVKTYSQAHGIAVRVMRNAQSPIAAKIHGYHPAPTFPHIRDGAVTVDAVPTGEATIQNLIVRIAAIPRGGQAISERIQAIRLLVAEDPDGADVSVLSLRAFLAFLQSVQAVKIPAISLTADGNLYASWREQDKTFSVHFVSPTVTHWVTFRPSPSDPMQKLRTSGVAPAELVLRIPETTPARWAFV